MKGHRSRGKAARVVVPRHGRAVRSDWCGSAPSIRLSASEKHALRSAKKIARERKGFRNLHRQAGEVML